VEKLNDWAVASRCKENGKTWTYPGTRAIAALEVARRNGELEYWRSTASLPSWEMRIAGRTHTYDQ